MSDTNSLNINNFKDDLCIIKEQWKINKKSNSKEEIKLEREGSIFFIKKTWFDIERGEKSIRKQIDFNEIKINDLLIKSPKIYDTQTINNQKLIAKMEYIEGNSGSDITLVGTRKTSLQIKDALSVLINLNLERSKIEEVKTNVLLKKLNLIMSSFEDEELFELLKSLESYLLNLKSIKIPIGPCHGDITLSNIIISSSGALHFIDFLPTFLETPLWDIVKLYQDLKYGWSYRDLAGPEKASAKLFFSNCLPSQLKIYKDVMCNQILIFDAFNLARLSPYIKDYETREWLIYHLRNAINCLN